MLTLKKEETFCWRKVSLHIHCLRHCTGRLVDYLVPNVRLRRAFPSADPLLYTNPVPV